MIELDLKELADLLIIRANDFESEVLKYEGEKLVNISITNMNDCRVALCDIEAIIEELNRKVK